MTKIDKSPSLQGYQKTEIEGQFSKEGKLFKEITEEKQIHVIHRIALAVLLFVSVITIIPCCLFSQRIQIWKEKVISGIDRKIVYEAIPQAISTPPLNSSKDPDNSGIDPQKHTTTSERDISARPSEATNSNITNLHPPEETTSSPEITRAAHLSAKTNFSSLSGQKHATDKPSETLNDLPEGDHSNHTNEHSFYATKTNTPETSSTREPSPSSIPLPPPRKKKGTPSSKSSKDPDNSGIGSEKPTAISTPVIVVHLSKTPNFNSTSLRPRKRATPRTLATLNHLPELDPPRNANVYPESQNNERSSCATKANPTEASPIINLNIPPTCSLPPSPRTSRPLVRTSLPSQIEGLIKQSYQKCNSSPRVNSTPHTDTLLYKLCKLVRRTQPKSIPDEFEALYKRHLSSHPHYKLSDFGECPRTPWCLDNFVLQVSAIEIAIKVRSLALIEKILELDPTLANKPAVQGWWPPLVAVAANDDHEFAFAAVELLISKGANPTITGAEAIFSSTALWEAAKKKNLKVVKYLILHGGIITADEYKFDEEENFNWPPADPLFIRGRDTVEQAMRELIEEANNVITYLKTGAPSDMSAPGAFTGFPSDLVDHIISGYLGYSAPKEQP